MAITETDRRWTDRDSSVLVLGTGQRKPTFLQTDRYKTSYRAEHCFTILFVCIKLVWLCLSMFVPPSIKFVFYAYLILNT